MRISAVELMRRERARITRETQGMSPAEEIAYFREGARHCRALIAQERAEELAHRQDEAGGAGSPARPAAAPAPAESRD